VTSRPPLGYVAQIWSSPTPQGFSYRQHGEGARTLVDFDGLALVRFKKKRRRKKEVDGQTNNA